MSTGFPGRGRVRPDPATADGGVPSREPPVAAARPATPVPGDSYCPGDSLAALERPARDAPPPWAPERREAIARMRRMRRGGSNTVYDDRLVLLSAVDIFADLSKQEIDAIAEAAPMRTYPQGALVYSPHHQVEALFILRGGRIRIFRLSPDGRALTTAIIQPGTIFGEMVLLGQQMHDSYAEALDEALVCVMSRADVHRFLLSDPRIAARIAETLGSRLKAMEQRYTDAVFKSVPQRIAAALCTLAGPGQGSWRPGASAATPVALTHEQVAALVGTSRETATKALGEFADRGLVKLGRGKIYVVDRGRLAAEAGDQW